GVVAKLAPARGLVWVSSLASGQPVVGAEVMIRDRSNRVRWSGRTGAGGLVETPGRDQLLGRATQALPEQEMEERWSGHPDELYIIVRTADDLALLADSWQPGTAAWSFGIEPDRTPAGVRVRGFLETDRGLYRPGDTVHVKGIVRTLAPGALLAT